MHRPLHVPSLVLALLAVAPACQDKTRVEPTKHPFLWRIEGTPANYLYGTVHVADKRVTEWPQVVQDALVASEVLVTELDMGPESQAAGIKASKLPAGQTLTDVLPEELYARLDAYCKSKRFPLEGLKTAKPWVVMTTLPLLEDLRTLMSGLALDAKLVQVATREGLATTALETLQEQLDVFEGFNAQEQAQMLDGTLRMLERAEKDNRKLMQELVQTYLGGDLAALEKTMDNMTGLEDLKELKARLEKLILTDRNHRMAERLVAKLRAEPKKAHFCAVGALHYPGEDGLLALLEKAGFKLVRVVPAPAAQPVETGAGKQPAGAGK